MGMPDEPNGEICRIDGPGLEQDASANRHRVWWPHSVFKLSTLPP